MKYASVCSGVEAATLAWMPLGWEAAWFSEIEPFPCAVLKERFPGVPNLGDMTKIKVENLENGDQRFTNGLGADVVIPGGVDLLVGGTPCQGFSVAGKQGGLDDERSVLCLTFTRLLDAMRPEWFVWENVPGVFSTNGGEDFKAFLRAIDEIGYSCAWRVLDAQYVRVDGYPRAVPQRRRRVFVIGHFGSEWEYPASVLFEPDCLQGYTPPRRIKGQGFASVAERSIGATGFDEYSRVIRMRAGKPGGGKGALVSEELSLTLGTGNDRTLIRTSGRLWDDSDVNPTLNQCNAGSGIIGASNQELFAQNFNGLVMSVGESNEMTAISIGNGQVDSLVNEPELAQTLNCMHDQQAVLCLNDQGGSVMQVEDNGTAGTLRANTHGNEQIVCYERSLTLAASGNDQPIICGAFLGQMGSKAGGIGYSEEVSPTVNVGQMVDCVCVHGAETPICNTEHVNPVTCNHNGLKNVVCYENHANDSRVKEMGDCCQTLSSRMGTGGGNVPLVQERIGYYPSQHHAPKPCETPTNTTKNCSMVRGDTPLVQECYAIDALSSNSMKSNNPNSGFHKEEIAKTLDAGVPDASRNQGGNVIVSNAVAIAENIIGRSVENGGNGVGAQEELAYTQNSTGVMGVASDLTVRRLLPVECERLMGFPDNWTRIPWKGKPEEECPDSPRYKACGNSMCVNVMRWIGMRIELVERKMK